MTSKELSPEEFIRRVLILLSNGLHREANKGHARVWASENLESARQRLGIYALKHWFGWDGPTNRYLTSPEMVESLRAAGFEVTADGKEVFARFTKAARKRLRANPRIPI